MTKINHINLIKPEDDRVYCRLLDKIVSLDIAHQRDFCSGCSMLAGFAQGNGVECEWEDSRKDVENPHVVTRPTMEKNWVTTHDAKSKE